MQEPHESHANLQHGSQSATRRGDYWARWQYTAEEWQLLDRLDWNAAKRASLLWGSGILLINALGFVFFILSSNATTLLDMLFFPALLLVVSATIFAAYSGRPLREAYRRHSARLNGPKRVTIGNMDVYDQAIWQGGLHIPLQALFLNLVKVKMTLDPPQLWLRRRHLGIRQASWFDSIHLLVPQGHEEEARHLLERFHKETIGAKKRRHPPAEPG